MTRDDAVTIVQMIVYGWPGAAWETERLEAYVEAILPWDAKITTHALARARNTLKYRPAISELREFVQIERRLSETEEAHYILPEKPEKPAWVIRWERARAAGDWRPFPEQITGMDTLARRDPDNYSTYAPPETPFSDSSVWVQPDEYQGEGSADRPAIVET